MKTQPALAAVHRAALTLLLSILNLQLSTARATPKVTKVAAGFAHSLFLKSDGSLWGMGLNDHGELGEGPNVHQSNFPQQIVASNVTAITAGDAFSLFQKSDGSLWVMGANLSGQLGDGTYTNHYVPEQIVSSQVTVLAAGAQHSLFGKYRFPLGPGSFWGMGYDFYGQLGIGARGISTNTPQEILSTSAFGAPAVTAVAAGGVHSLFIEPGGSLWGMGDNEYGQLGDGSLYEQDTPEEIVSSNVVAVAAGLFHSLFIKSDGSLWGMGLNGVGQLGDGGYSNAYAPEEIVSSNVVAVAAGSYHSLFIKSDGSLWGMGDNEYGQLGDPTTYGTNFPEEIVASNVVAVATGCTADYSLFVKADGSLWGMGYNEYGQLGDGSTNNWPVPIQILPYTIKNGGFETGDFEGWLPSGNLSQTFVTTKAIYVHSGRYGAQLGPIGTLGYLSQNYYLMAAGEKYRLSFWLDSFDGVTPNEFRVSWNGATLLDETNLPATGWTHFQFLVTATTSSAVLQFGFRNDNSYFGLDDISVVKDRQPVITSTRLAGNNLVLNASNGQSDSTYFTLMSTNVALPLNQWAPVATNLLNADGNFTITATNAMNPNTPQEFYTLQLQN